MIDINSGEVKFETEVAGLRFIPVSGISTRTIRGAHLVSVHSTTKTSEHLKLDDLMVTFKRMHKANEMLNGFLVLLDEKSGDSKWKYPIEVQWFQLLEGTPWDSPFLFLSRSNTYQTEMVQVRVQLAMIELASGKLKANELFKVPIRDDVFYKTVCLPKSGDQPSQTIELQIASLEARFHLKSQQTAPQPVASLVNAGTYKRMKEEIVTSVAALPLVTDLQSLIDEAEAAQKRLVKLREEEVRLTEIEMQSK